MSESTLLWIEIGFDVLYLITVWPLTGFMYKKRANLSKGNQRIGWLFMWSFFLLVMGDTGHVGFRVLAYALGGFEANPVLIGAGASAKAVTVTFFYWKPNITPIL